VGFAQHLHETDALESDRIRTGVRSVVERSVESVHSLLT
jgi:hypothetical protein